MTTTITPRPMRVRKELEDLCCMARCQRTATELVSVRLGGEHKTAEMCEVHAPAYRELARA